MQFLGDIDQTFINFTYHLRVDSYFLVQWTVFRYGEVITFQELQNLLEAPVGNSGFILLVEPVCS